MTASCGFKIAPPPPNNQNVHPSNSSDLSLSTRHTRGHRPQHFRCFIQPAFSPRGKLRLGAGRLVTVTQQTRYQSEARTPPAGDTSPTASMKLPDLPLRALGRLHDAPARASGPHLQEGHSHTPLHGRRDGGPATEALTKGPAEQSGVHMLVPESLFPNTTSPSSPLPKTCRRAPGGTAPGDRTAGRGPHSGAFHPGHLSHHARALHLPPPSSSVKWGYQQQGPPWASMDGTALRQTGHTECQVVRRTRRAAECQSHCPRPTSPGLSSVPNLLGQVLRSCKLLFCGGWDCSGAWDTARSQPGPQLPTCRMGFTRNPHLPQGCCSNDTG